MSGASERANGGANGPVLYASIPYHLNPLCAGRINANLDMASAINFIASAVGVVELVETGMLMMKRDQITGTEGTSMNLAPLKNDWLYRIQRTKLQEKLR